MHDPNAPPANLPVPVDDGAAAHLVGQRLPEAALESTSGTREPLPALCAGPTVLFFYPRTGIPGEPPARGFQGEEWDEIPGARGCTPQSCGFRDVHRDIAALGVSVFGVSTQTSAFQREFKERNAIPFHYLSDSALALVTSMRLPTFDFPVESGGPTRLIKRMAWFLEGGRIEQVWYPVFPPNENAARVLDWLRHTHRVPPLATPSTPRPA